MKEYRILREIENPRMGPNNHQILENRINELAREGWVVSLFSVSHTPAATGLMFSSNTYYCALLERESRTVRPR